MLKAEVLQNLQTILEDLKHFNLLIVSTNWWMSVLIPDVPVIDSYYSRKYVD